MGGGSGFLKRKTAKDAAPTTMEEGGLDDDGIDNMDPMKVSSSIDNDGEFDDDGVDNLVSAKKKWYLPSKFLLVTDENALRYSINTLRFSIMVSSINSKMLNPNYPIMVTPGAHPDSFPTTAPFDFNSATYFLSMCSMLGIAISSLFLGGISDRLGRKRILFLLALASGVGSIVKYFTRHTFWGFCSFQFAFGLFLGNLPVAMAYLGDIFVSKKEKQEQLGYIVACFVMGNSGGGIIAILMDSSGLFAPLWVGSVLSFMSSAAIAFYLIEPGDVSLQPIGKELLSQEEEEVAVVEGQDLNEDDDDVIKRPETIDYCKLSNIIGGALADNFGSTGLFPLCLSPLALTKYTIDFIQSDPPQEPIMSMTGYKWLAVMVAFVVVPSTQITPLVFNKIGVAGTCVFGNVCTALVTFALLMIGLGPTTYASFYGFVAVMYLGFPFTVFSQLTTGPMLDLIAPEDKLGYVQGLNNAAMNFGMAFAPWLLGLLADATGTSVAIWTGIGISLGAAAINVPLMCHEEFRAPPKPEPAAKRRLPGEDKDLLEKALRGSVIPPEALLRINHQRIKRGEPMIVPAVKPYKEDKEDGLRILHRQAEERFRFRMEIQDRILAAIDNPEEGLERTVRLLNEGDAADDTIKNQATNDLGKWVGEYLKDNGYKPHVQSLLLKTMITSAFPPIMEGENYTTQNIEEALVKERRIMNQYLNVRKRQNQNHTFATTLGNGGTQQFYS